MILTLASCSDDVAPPPGQPNDGTGTASETQRDVATPANRALPSTIEPFPLPPQAISADTGLIDSASSGAWTTDVVEVDSPDGRIAVVTAIRSAQNPGFDRFVIEFRGSVLPAYQVQYAESAARECGSGEVVEVRGSGRLLVRLQPAQAHNEDGSSTLPARNQTPGLQQLQEIRMTCDFEAHVEWVLGVSGQTGFRVFGLSEPQRIVIDLRH